MDLPFSNAELIEHVPVGKLNQGSRTITGIWELLVFWFSEEQEMPPRTVSRPNWQLILTCSSMAITILTLIISFVWSASSKNTNLDSITTLTTNNANDIRKTSDAVSQMQVQMQSLKDQQQAVLDKLSDLKLQLQQDSAKK